MDDALIQTLAEAIQAIESGADIDVVVASYPAHADALRSHLGLWAHLQAAPRAEPGGAALASGKAGMLAALGAPPIAPIFPMTVLAKAIAVTAGVVVLGASVAGASAALGGPDFAGGALESVGVSHRNEHSEGADTTVAGDAENGGATNPNPNDNANSNAFEGCENRDDGIGNVDDSAAGGVDNADPRASDGGEGAGGNCEQAQGSGAQGQPDDPGQQGQGQPETQPPPRVTPPPPPEGNQGGSAQSSANKPGD